MKAAGNGNPETCVANLLKIVRGEVPYSRLKGRDGMLIDQAGVDEDIIADAEQLIEEYEERVAVESIEMIREDVSDGDFLLIANIANEEEDEEVEIYE